MEAHSIGGAGDEDAVGRIKGAGQEFSQLWRAINEHKVIVTCMFSELVAEPVG